MAKTSFAEMEDKGKNSPTKKPTKTKAKAETGEGDAGEEPAEALIEQPSERGELAITNQQLSEAGLA